MGRQTVRVCPLKSFLSPNLARPCVMNPCEHHWLDCWLLRWAATTRLRFGHNETPIRCIEPHLLKAIGKMTDHHEQTLQAPSAVLSFPRAHGASEFWAPPAECARRQSEPSGCLSLREALWLHHSRGRRVNSEQEYTWFRWCLSTFGSEDASKMVLGVDWQNEGLQTFAIVFFLGVGLKLLHLLGFINISEGKCLAFIATGLQSSIEAYFRSWPCFKNSSRVSTLWVVVRVCALLSEKMYSLCFVRKQPDVCVVCV